MMKTQQLLFAILGVILCWLIVPGIFYGLSESLDKAGQLGDVFGVVNALFSGLAFAILINRKLASDGYTFSIVGTR